MISWATQCVGSSTTYRNKEEVETETPFCLEHLCDTHIHFHTCVIQGSTIAMNMLRHKQYSEGMGASGPTLLSRPE